MRTGLLFPRLVDPAIRAAVEERLLTIGCLIPSVKSFHENLKQLAIGVKILRDLVLGVRSRNTLEGALRMRWTESQDVLIESSPDTFHIATLESVEHCWDVVYKQLWINALRNFAGLGTDSPRKENGYSHPKEPPNPIIQFEFAKFAKSLGFKTSKLEIILKYDSRKKIIRSSMEQIYHLKASVLDTLVNEIVSKLPTTEDTKTKPNSGDNWLSQVDLDDLDRRSGVPYNHAYESARGTFFLTNITNGIVEPSDAMPSVRFIQGDFISAFFGPTTSFCDIPESVHSDESEVGEFAGNSPSPLEPTFGEYGDLDTSTFSDANVSTNDPPNNLTHEGSSLYVPVAITPETSQVRSPNVNFPRVTVSSSEADAVNASMMMNIDRMGDVDVVDVTNEAPGYVPEAVLSATPSLMSKRLPRKKPNAKQRQSTYSDKDGSRRTILSSATFSEGGSENGALDFNFTAKQAVSDFQFLAVSTQQQLAQAGSTSIFNLSGTTSRRIIRGDVRREIQAGLNNQVPGFITEDARIGSASQQLALSEPTPSNAIADDTTVLDPSTLISPPSSGSDPFPFQLASIPTNFPNPFSLPQDRPRSVLQRVPRTATSGASIAPKQLEVVQRAPFEPNTLWSVSSGSNMNLTTLVTASASSPVTKLPQENRRSFLTWPATLLPALIDEGSNMDTANPPMAGDVVNQGAIIEIDMDSQLQPIGTAEGQSSTEGGSLLQQQLLQNLPPESRRSVATWPRNSPAVFIAGTIDVPLLQKAIDLDENPLTSSISTMEEGSLIDAKPLVTKVSVRQEYGSQQTEQEPVGQVSLPTFVQDPVASQPQPEPVLSISPNVVSGSEATVASVTVFELPPDQPRSKPSSLLPASADGAPPTMEIQETIQKLLMEPQPSTMPLITSNESQATKDIPDTLKHEGLDIPSLPSSKEVEQTTIEQDEVPDSVLRSLVQSNKILGKGENTSVDTARIVIEDSQEVQLLKDNHLLREAEETSERQSQTSYHSMQRGSVLKETERQSTQRPGSSRSSESDSHFFECSSPQVAGQNEVEGSIEPAGQETPSPDLHFNECNSMHTIEKTKRASEMNSYLTERRQDFTMYEQTSKTYKTIKREKVVQHMQAMPRGSYYLVKKSHAPQWIKNGMDFLPALEFIDLGTSLDSSECEMSMVNKAVQQGEVKFLVYEGSSHRRILKLHILRYLQASNHDTFDPESYKMAALLNGNIEDSSVQHFDLERTLKSATSGVLWLIRKDQTRSFIQWYKESQSHVGQSHNEESLFLTDSDENDHYDDEDLSPIKAAKAPRQSVTSPNMYLPENISESGTTLQTIIADQQQLHNSRNVIEEQRDNPLKTNEGIGKIKVFKTKSNIPGIKTKQKRKDVDRKKNNSRIRKLTEQRLGAPIAKLSNHDTNVLSEGHGDQRSQALVTKLAGDAAETLYSEHQLNTGKRRIDEFSAESSPQRLRFNSFEPTSLEVSPLETPPEPTTPEPTPLESTPPELALAPEPTHPEVTTPEHVTKEHNIKRKYPEPIDAEVIRALAELEPPHKKNKSNKLSPKKEQGGKMGLMGVEMDGREAQEDNTKHVERVEEVEEEKVEQDEAL